MTSPAISPWTCPNCGLLIGQLTPQRLLPEGGGVYRCPVCHLELAFDPNGRTLTRSETVDDMHEKSTNR